MDILAVASPGPRHHERAQADSSGDKSFASLLGLGSERGDAAPPKRRRSEDEVQEAAAAVAQPIERRPVDETPPSADGSEPAAGAAAAEPAAGQEQAPDAPEQAATQPGQGTAEAEAGGAAEGTKAAARPAAAVPQQPAGPAQAALADPAAQAAAQGATSAAPAAAEVAGQRFRLPGQMAGQVAVDTAAQAPRAALSGNTALAASLAGSGGAAGQQAGAEGGPAPDALESLQAGGQAAGKAAPTAGTKDFAALAAEAAGQAQAQGQDDVGAGRTPVLQAAGGDDILLPGAADGQRLQATPAAQAATASTAASQSAGAQAPMADQVAGQVHRALTIGKDRLSIQLHPAELGRVDIKLELGSDGPVRAVLHAERKETLELLQRDVRGLERALQNAGLQTDAGSISFDLRGGGQQQRSGQGFSPAYAGADQGTRGSSAEGGDSQPQPSRAEARHDGAVNIRV